MKIERRLLVDGAYIRDADGRIVMLRGCNLGGDSKIPFTPAGNPLQQEVSFIGRPFPEAEADMHFSLLKNWGFTFLRFIFTWEAVEHDGPGIYDEGYLAYLRVILKKAEEYGIQVFMDPHQDVWSRWTGGDGAPAWTLEAVGFDLDAISASGSAITMQAEGKAYTPMCWSLNYLRYAAATMNTLFFGGNRYAPACLVEGVPVQEWLQDRYIAMLTHTARRLKDCAAIVGFGILNEPHPGYIGLDSLDSHARITAAKGTALSAFDSMRAASGFSVSAPRFTLFGMLTLPFTETVNPHGISLFRKGYGCPWKAAGVWKENDGAGELVKRDYFSGVSFSEDFLKPFQKKCMEALSKKHGHYIFFVEGVPMGESLVWKPEERFLGNGEASSIVDALHWYDGITLLTKKWRSWLAADGETSVPVFGKRAVKHSYREQLRRMAARPRKEGMPALLGEFGLPFDLDGGRAFRMGDFSRHERALAAYYDAIDAALLHSTIWNYSASCSHEAGDGWNTECLSIYCAQDGGGRAVRGFSRPYAMATAGIPQLMSFDAKKAVFHFEWDALPGRTEIFVPTHWYPNGWRVVFEPAPACKAVIEEKSGEQRLYVSVEGKCRVALSVFPCSDLPL